MEEDAEYTQVALVLLGDWGCGVAVVGVDAGTLSVVSDCLGLTDVMDILQHRRRLLWHFLEHGRSRVLCRQLRKQVRG